MLFRSVNLRFKLDMHTCGECKRAEYACICDHDHDHEPRWKHDGVRVIPAGSLDTNTAQTPGMDRRAAINFARVGAQKLWAGTVTIHANAKTGAHHRCFVTRVQRQRVRRVEGEHRVPHEAAAHGRQRQHDRGGEQRQAALARDEGGDVGGGDDRVPHQSGPTRARRSLAQSPA